jgi:hypothetical protein
MRQAKLLQVALNPDLAHGKVRDEAEFEENVAKKESRAKEIEQIQDSSWEKVDEGQEAQEASREQVTLDREARVETCW